MRTTISCSLPMLSSHLHPGPSGRGQGSGDTLQFQLHLQAAAQEPPHPRPIIPRLRPPSRPALNSAPRQETEKASCFPLSSHQENRPRVPVGVGTAADQAGRNPLQGWEPPLPDGCGQGWAGLWWGGGGASLGGPAWESPPALCLCSDSEQVWGQQLGRTKCPHQSSIKGRQ